MFVITDIGKLFLFFTYHDNHIIHGSRILFFFDYGSQKINSVDHVSRETPLRPLIKATSVHDETPRTRTELPASIVFHVMLTSVDSYRCDSCLARLFQNLPAPPKHYGVSDVLLIRKVFAKAKNLGSHLAKACDDRFPPQSKQILAKISQVRKILFRIYCGVPDSVS